MVDPNEQGVVVVRGGGDGFAQEITAGRHRLTADEPVSVDLHLEGRVIGDVSCATLILGEKASIRGSVHADRVKASGLIEGSVETNDLSVEPTARLVGDVDFENVQPIAGKITPNPGGVGPMTIAMLMVNTVRAAELAAA